MISQYKNFYNSLSQIFLHGHLLIWGEGIFFNRPVAAKMLKYGPGGRGRSRVNWLIIGQSVEWQHSVLRQNKRAPHPLIPSFHHLVRLSHCILSVLVSILLSDLRYPSLSPLRDRLTLSSREFLPLLSLFFFIVISPTLLQYFPWRKYRN